MKPIVSIMRLLELICFDKPARISTSFSPFPLHNSSEGGFLPSSMRRRFSRKREMGMIGKREGVF